MTGDKGIVGDQGVLGNKGLTGDQGSVGTKGVTGDQGTVGNKGAVGSTGEKGLIGDKGVDGDKGLLGDPGTVTGIQGLTGEKGAVGAKGDIGLTGSFTGDFVGDVTGTQIATVVEKINGTSFATLATGILKNTTSTGIPSIAIATDFPLLNQSTTGTAANVSGIILPSNGGTGIANSDAATLTLPGEFRTTLTTTGTTSVTLPTSGTLATEAYVLANSGSQSYSVSAGDEIFTFATADETIPGMTISPALAGKYAVSFNSQFKLVAVARTPEATKDLRTLYNGLTVRAGTKVHAIGYGNETLTPGVYTQETVAAATNVGVITLDAQDDANAEFIFIFGAAWTTAASSKLVLIRGATANNVYWIAEGAMSLGSYSEWQGTIISHAGAVSMGLSSKLNGRMLSISGAISLNSSTISLPSIPSSLIGSLASFAMFTILGNVTTVGSSTVNGDLGTDDSAGSITGFDTSIKGTMFTASNSVTSAKTFLSIYKGNTLQQYSTRSRISSMNEEDIGLHGIVEVAAGDAINIRWRMDAGSVKLQNRILTLIQVR